ncbi:unnamed protein product [Caenorhabditis brenneri]
MTIPLLCLPLLASTKIIKYIDVKYLISLIQLSKRAKTLVKLSEVHIELTVFQSSIQFQKLAGQGMVGRLEFSDSSEKPADVPFKPPRHSKFDSTIQYQIRAYKKMIDDFVEFFKVCSVSFKLESACSYTSLSFMEHAKDLGLKFSTARVLIGGANRGVYQDLLKVCSSASQLLVHFNTDEPFTFQGFNEYKMHEFRFAAKNRGFNWFTVNHMCALLDCLEVLVTDINWSDEDFNQLLKFWMASEGNLKSWKFWACHGFILPEVVMEGINNRELGNDKFEIQRADGVKAEVALSYSTCTLKVIDA